MKIYNQVRNFFEKKATRWYIVVFVLGIIEIVNYGFLGLAIPLWACNVITIFVSILAICYMEIMYNFLRKKVKIYMTSREEELEKQLNLIVEHIDDLNKKNIELQSEIFDKTTMFISDGLKGVVGEVKEYFVNGTTKINDLIKVSTDFIESTAELRNNNLIQSLGEHKNQVEELIKNQKDDLDKKLTEQREITKESTANIQNEIKENALTSASDFYKLSKMFSQQSELTLSNINQNRSEIDKMADQIRYFEETSKSLLSNTSTLIVENIVANREISKKSIVSATDKVMENSNTNRETIEEKISEILTIATKSIDDTRSLIQENILEVSKEHEQRLSLKIIEVGDKLNHGEVNSSENFNRLFISIEGTKDACTENNRIISSLIEEKITLLDNSSSEKMEVLSNDINQKMNEISTVVYNSKENILDEMKLDVQSVLEKIKNINDESKGDFKEQADIISDYLRKIKIQTEGLSTYTSEMQAELSKLLVQILNNTDENLDTSKNAYEGIFSQIVGFSKETTNHLKILEQRVEDLDKAAEQGRKVAEFANDERSDRELKLNNKVEVIEDFSQKSQSEINAKLDNIKNQISNLNMLAEVLKKVAEVQQISGQANRVSSDLEPKRIEEINDVETGVKVLNHYKNNKLILSEMVSGKQKDYEVEYDESGKVIRSKNFDDKGNVTTDLQYYDNGQVKVRIEKITIDGKQQTITSYFDEDGNKIN